MTRETNTNYIRLVPIERARQPVCRERPSISASALDRKGTLASGRWALDLIPSVFYFLFLSLQVIR